MSEVNSTHQVCVAIFNLIDFFTIFTARNICVILELKRKEKNTSKTKVKRKYMSKCTTPKTYAGAKERGSEYLTISLYYIKCNTWSV